MPGAKIEPTLFATYPTPVGPLLAQATESGLLRLDFKDRARRFEAPSSGPLGLLGDELERYFAGERVEFLTPLRPQGTPFQQAVWNALRTIPHGATRSYTQIAESINRPDASRAVGRANALNPISILIPCHRVIGAGGALTGYAAGLERKRWLLDLEQGQRMLSTL